MSTARSRIFPTVEFFEFFELVIKKGAFWRPFSSSIINLIELEAGQFSDLCDELRAYIKSTINITLNFFTRSRANHGIAGFRFCQESRVLDHFVKGRGQCLHPFFGRTRWCG